MSTLNIEQFQRDVLIASLSAIEQFRADFPNVQGYGFALYGEPVFNAASPSAATLRTECQGSQS